MYVWLWRSIHVDTRDTKDTQVRSFRVISKKFLKPFTLVCEVRLNRSRPEATLSVGRKQPERRKEDFFRSRFWLVLNIKIARSSARPKINKEIVWLNRECKSCQLGKYLLGRKKQWNDKGHQKNILFDENPFERIPMSLLIKR